MLYIPPGKEKKKKEEGGVGSEVNRDFGNIGGKGSD